ncbi:MAG: 30S ribosomal protein S20 [Spirochaetota bacterium]
MPNIASAIKRVRKSAVRREHNRSIKSELHTLDVTVQKLITEKKGDDARKAFVMFAKALDKAACKKVIHKNAAARKKSRIAQKINTLVAAK